ncbi:hypothetical protein CDL12_04394 [Handroanthus impetiginosus]|uniref:Uncharacterized protein n=1 Tax=Handroanthus impetiginosus TaxID=429701 RepID=A0A2G9HZF9_9LAMI|nr:hypothetical protein CDL12_04394 [Handroanthus impetiginosus]
MILLSRPCAEDYWGDKLCTQKQIQDTSQRFQWSTKHSTPSDSVLSPHSLHVQCKRSPTFIPKFSSLEFKSRRICFTRFTGKAHRSLENSNKLKCGCLCGSI